MLFWPCQEFWCCAQLGNCANQMSTLSTSSVSLFLPRLLPASIPHFVHSHSLTRKSVQCSKELMNTHLLLKNLEKNCLILVKCSMQYLQHKIGLQCGNDKIGSSYSHSIILGNWLKLKISWQAVHVFWCPPYMDHLRGDLKKWGNWWS